MVDPEPTTTAEKNDGDDIRGWYYLGRDEDHCFDVISG